MSSILKSLKKLEKGPPASDKGWQPQQGADGRLALAPRRSGKGSIKPWAWCAGVLALIAATAGIWSFLPLPGGKGETELRPTSAALHPPPAPAPAIHEPPERADALLPAVAASRDSVTQTSSLAEELLLEKLPLMQGPTAGTPAVALSKPREETTPAHGDTASFPPPAPVRELSPERDRPVATPSPAVDPPDARLPELPRSLLSLQAIAWAETPAERIAVINNQVVREGGSVEGFLVRRIDAQQVVLEKDLETWKLVFQGQ